MAKGAEKWVVDFDSDAVIDFEDVKSRGDRFVVLAVAAKKKTFARSVVEAAQRFGRHG